MADVKVVREELTYHPHAERSYFKDLGKAKQGDFAASQRLERHGREVRDEIERRDVNGWATKPGDVEFRVNPNRTTGQGGSFAPPLWLIDAFATLPRAHRVLANEIPGFTLPQGVQTVNIPRLTTGLTTQTVADDAVDPGTDAVDTSVTSPVVTISGQGDVSLQALEQSPPGAHLDWAFFKDLSEDYDSKLEAQLINGSGTGSQLTGVLNASGIGTVTYTSGTPKATDMFTFIGQAVASVGKNRLMPPECWLMSTSRFAWLGSSEDSQNRPLMLTDKDDSGETDLLSFAVRLTDAMPTNLGAGTNQDAIVACRPSDMLLFESAPRAEVMLDVLSGTLQARIRLHRYVAALVGRYPSAISALRGTGMVVQSGF